MTKMNNYNVNRFSVRIVDQNEEVLCGFYTPDYDDNGREQSTGVLKNRNGRWRVTPKFIHQNTGFCSYKRDDSGTTILGGDIFEYDVVKITFVSGTAFTYLICYVSEMNYLVAIPTDCLYFNDFDFYTDPQNEIEWSDFAFRMQDPWGNIKSVEVVGMLNPSRQYFNFSDDGKVKVDII